MGEDPATVNMFQGAPEGHPNLDSGHSRALYRNEECYKAITQKHLGASVAEEHTEGPQMGATGNGFQREVSWSWVLRKELTFEMQKLPEGGDFPIGATT